MVRLSLRQKIVGGFGLLIFLMLLLGWVTLLLFGSVRSVQGRVFDSAVPGVIAVDEIVRSYTAQSAAIRGFVINPNQRSLLAEYRTEVQASEAATERARELFTSDRERELLQDIEAEGESFQTLVDDRVVMLAESGERGLAFGALGSEGAAAIDQIQALGRGLRRIQAITLDRTESDLVARSNQAVITLLIVLIGVISTGVFLTLLIPRRLAQDLSRLVEAARAIGRGDFHQRIEIKSGDEVEELASRFEEMQAGLRRLQQLALQDRELQIAGSIQRNLLQRTMPESPGARLVPLQRQANLVGGDWYDIDVDGRTLTAVVGDASGKGIGAALMATVTLSALRAERSVGSGPRRVIARANEALLEATEPDSFTTLLYASIDLVSGEVHWLNMGHPSPFLIRSNLSGKGAGYFLEGPRNRALGWFEDPGLAETVIKLEPGDRLALYTDGFLEAKSPDGEIFGESRLAEAIISLAPLDSETIGQELVREVEGFAAGKLEDDLTMLIIEFEGSPATEVAQEKLTGEEPWHSRR
ncbi:MAG: PP2C family protein-serine/threonine phosphatase [Actinomycetota bacterium]|nr:SpoIIE family protein phosphatase [Actinomycetota bacterium]